MFSCLALRFFKGAGLDALRTDTVGSQDELRCGAIPGHGMPCPYECDGQVKGAQLKLAATKSKPWFARVFPQTVEPL